MVLGVVQTQKGEVTLTKSASTTCEIIRLFNDLFDSFNGKNGQGLSSIITPTSGHILFWEETCKKLRKMRYVDKESRKVPIRNAPKCLKNWIWTIQGAEDIWKKFHCEAQFESFNLKFLNQDVLENFFSQVRSNGCANRIPSCEQFEGAFKTLLISNLTSKHSFGANCEEDTDGMTLAFSNLINVSEANKEIDNAEEICEVECNEPAIPATNVNEKIIDEKKILDIIKRNKIIAQCDQCANNIVNILDIRQAIEILEFRFVEICHEVKLMEKTMKILEDQCFLSCPQQCTH